MADIFSIAKQLTEISNRLACLAESLEQCKNQNKQPCNGENQCENQSKQPCNGENQCKNRENPPACVNQTEIDKTEHICKSNVCVENEKSHCKTEKPNNSKPTETSYYGNNKQIGGGINGIMNNSGKKKLPKLSNLFGGLGGLGGLCGIQIPKSAEEIKNNPQIMSMLENLENNPTLLNLLCGIGGMNKEQILQAVNSLKQTKCTNDTPNTADTATPTEVSSGQSGNILENFNSLGNLSKLFGGNQLPGNMGNGMNIMNGIPNQGFAQPKGMPIPVNGDPLTNLLNQWHWTPFRS